MSGITDHFDALVNSSQDAHTGDGRSLEEWGAFINTIEHTIPMDRLEEHSQFAEVERNQSSTVLQLYQDRTNTENFSLIHNLYQKPNSRLLLENLLSILSSLHPNEEISGEVAELVGFQDIEIVMEIINNRSTITQELSDHLLNAGMRDNSPKVIEASVELSSLQNLSSGKARKRMEERFRENASRPQYSGTAIEAPETLPHVYTSAGMAQGNVLSQFGSKYMLPLGTSREMHEEYEEVIIPPAKPVPPRITERLLPVSDLDSLAKGCFPGYSSLNRIQSIVYPTAYNTNENMLICAPTGAGKTDVAMLTILHVINQHRSSTSEDGSIRASINRDAFKIIYVAPMKALASEIVRKLGKRLQWLGIQVRELTGDMQLTKAEIAQTQIIVTTPEKWDVVTRKPTGEGELASSLKLLIIDEVHLLNEERGAVIETIVARTLRQVESSQSMIRIVGLSATLPNYIDVAEFLSVSRYKGLFYFDSSFRPVPLEQHFLGIKGKTGSAQSRKNLDHVTFEKVSQLVAEGHQVMVFVHARKETVKTAMTLRELSVIEGNIDDFSCEDHPQYNIFRRNIGESRNKEMKLLFDSGFGIHHAGMLRSDRNMMERMFEARAIKVLCCTATLAWGVNLPAHAVIIKGTQVYDSSKGAFVDLSVLDVLQVFGRAGRPGLETRGEGYICTTEDKLTHYLDAVTSQIPIESQFQTGMIDSLNAEVSLGTVANIRDAVQWLGYTYLFVRMRKNPFIYGIARDVAGDDPLLGGKRNDLVTTAAQKLADARMIAFDRASGSFTITDLGRIAAKYYIRFNSIETFNKEFRPKMSEADVLAMLSMSAEFDQLQIRESEVEELEQLMERNPCDVKGGTDTSKGKVNILLQSFISRLAVQDFALVSDMAYAAQNGGRIIRALLEIAISREWANVTAVLIGLSKAVEKRLWPFDHPLKQFDLKSDVLYGLQQWADEWSVAQLAAQDAASLGELVHLNEIHGRAILQAAKQFPTAEISYDLLPLGADVLKITLRVKRSFTWSSKIHGNAEPFWLWIEDQEGINILQLSHLVFRESADVIKADFIISVPNGQPPPFLTIRWVSDRWMGAEDEVYVSLESLIMPAPSQCHTGMIDVPFLSTTAFDRALQAIFLDRIQSLNTFQTRAYWSLVHTSTHSLLSAPAGNGKTTMAQIVVWTHALSARNAWIFVVVPRKSSALALFSEFKQASHSTAVSVQFGEEHNLLLKPRGKIICITTTATLLRALSDRKVISAPVTGLDLVVCDNMEQLDSTYELAISLLRHAVQSSPTRFIGFSNSLNDPADLADWIDVDPIALFSFRPRDRDLALSFSTQTFTITYSASLFKAMAKPAHMAIQSILPGESALAFVPSRGQCPIIARDLITQCTLETEASRGYLPDGAEDVYLEGRCQRLQDTTLLDFILKGVGFFHQGLHKTDRNLMLELYAEGIIRVLIVPKEACWTVPVRAAAVVVMGTQFVFVESGTSNRQVCDYDLVELVQMQSRAVRHSGSGHFYLFCQSESSHTFSRFLNEGLPLESCLLEDKTLEAWYTAQVKRRGGPMQKQELVDMLSFTFLARRIVSNPSYYGFMSGLRDQNMSRVADSLAVSAFPE
ncbi:Sec63 Brl domain-containing protein [Crucibulum laeve]|uniref:Sec63 Brl domain-containing protein n=1 Tax=Crucibulum laeve TaxID=68775 RepID=A0A5C3MDV2_9AGAR|nr:Sec63 Brl domain-containing protein [Crucibulum laeve]